MNPIDPSLIAAADQLHATTRTLAELSRAIYDSYRQEGFTPQQSFDVVKLWNEHWAGMACRTS